MPVGTLLLSDGKALRGLVNQDEEMDLTLPAEQCVEQLEGSLIAIGGHVQANDRLLLVVVDGRIVVKPQLSCLGLADLAVTEDGVRTVERVIVGRRIGLRLDVLLFAIPTAQLAAATRHAVGVIGIEVQQTGVPQVDELPVDVASDVLDMARIEHPFPILGMVHITHTAHLTGVLTTADSLGVFHSFGPFAVVLHLGDETAEELSVHPCPACYPMRNADDCFEHDKGYHVGLKVDVMISTPFGRYIIMNEEGDGRKKVSELVQTLGSYSVRSLRSIGEELNVIIDAGLHGGLAAGARYESVVDLGRVRDEELGRDSLEEGLTLTDDVEHTALCLLEVGTLHLDGLHQVTIEGGIELRIVLLNPLHSGAALLLVTTGDDLREGFLEDVAILVGYTGFLLDDFPHLVVYALHFALLGFCLLAKGYFLIVVGDIHSDKDDAYEGNNCNCDQCHGGIVN